MKLGICMCTKVIVHRGKLEPGCGIPTITGRITDVETDNGNKHFLVL